VISRNDILDAITKCVGYDPVHAPKQSEIIENAWVEHFEAYPSMNRDQLLTAIAEYYRTPHRPFPQPADLSVIVRIRREDDWQRRSSPELQPRPASAEHRAKCMAEIRAIINKQANRWSIPEAL
jgi:hypothetical protein